MEASVTKSPEARHKVHKGSRAITKNGGKTQSELMTQGQQVVSNIHAVVMVNGSQLGQLLKVLPRSKGRKGRKGNHLLLKSSFLESCLSSKMADLGFHHCLPCKC